jgi:hypothetical protein
MPAWRFGCSRVVVVTVAWGADLRSARAGRQVSARRVVVVFKVMT